MGNSCSSGQAHKDKDNMSQRSEESGSYQIRTSLPSEKQQTLLNHITSSPHSGVILEPNTAGRPTLQLHQPSAQMLSSSSALEKRPHFSSRVLKGVTGCSISGDSMSLSSPPGMQSPTKEFDKFSDAHIPSEVLNLSEQLQNLIMGRVTDTKTTTRTRKIVIYVCAAESQDCCVEKGTLHNTVYPKLRAHCRKNGYELHIVDLHWKTLLEKQQDHEFPELCIGELIRQMEVAYVIPVLFLNNSLGTPLLPITIESTDFKMMMESAENQSAQSLLSKWYQLDSDAQPPCYRLQPISSHISGFKETSPAEREKAFEEWRAEIDKMLAVLVAVFSQELRDTYLTTVVEQEVHNTVFMSQELAKRCIWMNRIYTPTPRTPTDNLSAGDLELHRRLNTLQKDLRNHLIEKHIVRISVKYIEGGLNLTNSDHLQYVTQVSQHLEKHLIEMIDSIIDEHQEKTILKANYGIDLALFEELNQQTSFCQKAAQCSINREKTIEEIKMYILNSDCKSPLVLYGPGGCGKTTLLARIAQCCQQWLPEAFMIIRFIGISAQSSTFEQLLNSITSQCSILTYGYKCNCTHNVADYEKILPTLLTASCLQRPLIILLDGIDQVRTYSTRTIDWLPTKLPDNVKLILSVSESSDFYQNITKIINNPGCFIKLPPLGEVEAKNILLSSVVQYNHSVNSKIQDCVLKSVQECTLPLYSKVLAWQTSWWADKENEIIPKGNVNDQLRLMLEELETILGDIQVQHALAILTCTKHGVTDSEIIDLLAFDENFHSNTTYVSWAPACLAWSRLNKYLAPFLQWTLTGGVLGVQWKDNLLRTAVVERYKEHSKWAHQMIYDYYMGKWWKSKPSNVTARLVSQDTILGKCYNRRKLDELPFQHYHLLLLLNEDIDENDLFYYLSNIDWIYAKICGSNCFQILEDINLHSSNIITNDLINLLRSFLETYSTVLNYDGRQFYAHMYRYLDDKLTNKNELLNIIDPKILQLYEICRNPPVLSYVPQQQFTEDNFNNVNKTMRMFLVDKAINMIVRLPNLDHFVVSISTNKEEIRVWSVTSCKTVRLLTGIPHPTNLIPIDQYRCIVLCRRELRIYDLNYGTFVTKLKGVMNQKMPYYGLHDPTHLVALSRNRMYINLMNIETGDCITTFKAGEDRFLNSLLVSGDGRILVCGDETQKPFPLLVWNLESKKLLYDLRIPHHDFLTSLSAITYEGNYVCCVCHEIIDEPPNPNFIVVYDLQSGTLFKKWKPICDTVSLKISSESSCVISGLEDSRILVWDLITGNCRWSFYGHTSPVSCLKLDPTGVFCLSMDMECRDMSIRVWNLKQGSLLSVYTPTHNITACEITSNGYYVILALEGYDNYLLVLQLKGPGVENNNCCQKNDELYHHYGVLENTGKIFEFKDSNLC